MSKYDIENYGFPEKSEDDKYVLYWIVHPESLLTIYVNQYHPIETCGENIITIEIEVEKSEDKLTIIKIKDPQIHPDEVLYLNEIDWFKSFLDKLAFTATIAYKSLKRLEGHSFPVLK